MFKLLLFLSVFSLLQARPGPQSEADYEVNYDSYDLYGDYYDYEDYDSESQVTISHLSQQTRR